MYIAFEKEAHEHMIVTARTDCRVVFWELEDLNVLATQASPALSAYWRNFALCQVSVPLHRGAGAEGCGGVAAV